VWTPIDAPPLTHLLDHPLTGRFLARPNRFTAVVEIAGDGCVVAHVPNPGRLTGTLVPGCEVWLDGPFPPPRRLPYTLLAAREADTWVGTVTTYANAVFPTLVARGLFPELAGRRLVAELRHGRSRFDFRVGRTTVEVKSVTLAEAGGGRFPDAVTARGARHCLELARLARRRQPAAIVFVAQRGDVRWVEPDDAVDPRFGAALRAAARAGVRLLACALEIGPRGAQRVTRVPVRLDPHPP
jgi:sugar fermentation stimulation protein